MTKLKLFVLTHMSSLKTITTRVLYVIFAYYIGHLVIVSPSIITKLFVLSIGSIVLSILFLFDHLKVIYGKMITSLTIECDIQQAIHYKQRLIARDIFKGFKQSLILFDGLLLLDQGNYQDCLTHLKTHEVLYHSTLDYLLITHRTRLQCAYFLSDSTLFDQSYKRLKSIKYNSTKKTAPSPLYSWDEIDGLHYFRQQRNLQAKKTLANITTERFNPREEAYLFFERAQVEFSLGNTSEGNRLLKKVTTSSNQLHLSKLGEQRERVTFEKY